MNNNRVMGTEIENSKKTLDNIVDFIKVNASLRQRQVRGKNANDIPGDNSAHIEHSHNNNGYGTPVLQDSNGVNTGFENGCSLKRDTYVIRNNTNTNNNDYNDKFYNNYTENIELSGSLSQVPDVDVNYTTGDCSSSLNDHSLMFADPPQPQSNKVTILVAFFVAVGGFLYGYDTGIINSIIDMEYVRKNFATNHEYFTAKQLSIIVSFLSLGTFVGALFAPVISDKYGRKAVIILSTVIIFLAGNSLQVAASNIPLLVAGRVISGIGVGLISAVVPLYQGEAANKLLRGAIISTYQWAITWGLLVSSAVSQGTYKRNDSSSYRIPIGLQYIWSFVLAIGMFFLPESPRHYVLKDQLDKAASSLSFLRGVPVHDSGLLEELVEIKATYDYEMSFGTSSLLDCFRSSKARPKQTLRIISGIALNAFQQLSGINFIFYYGVNFFNRTGVQNSYRISFITYAVNVAFNIPGLFLVECLGRRKLLLYGGALMTISNFIIAIVGTSASNLIADKVMIAFICSFIASFSASWGSTVWVVSAELYPLGVRSKCMAICAASNWLFNFFCALITPYIVDITSHTSTIGPKIFFLWGSLNAAGVLFVYFAIFETKGLTLEEIDELFDKCPNCFESEEWNEKIRRDNAEAKEKTAWSRQDVRAVKSIVDLSNESLASTILENNNNYISDRNDDYNDYYHHYNLKRANTCKSKNDGIEYNEEAVVMSVSDDTTNRSTSDHHLQGVVSLTTELDDPQSNYVDLGNGLGLNTYNRGPPSLPSDSSDEED